MSNELAVVNAAYIEARRMVARLDDVKQAMLAVRTLHAEVLRKDIDFGVIPGTGNKPCLLKPGAESLLMAFQLGVGDPEITHVYIDAPTPGHIEYRVKLPIIYRATGQVIGYGVASCSTMEKKYRYRSGERVCPKCSLPHIRHSKDGGWYCWAKLGGCGAKFADNAAEITGQSIGQVENPDPADQYNTCLKMAKKRALIDGALTCCAASGTFTQDVDERLDEAYTDPPEPQRRVTVTRVHNPADTPADDPGYTDLQPPIGMTPPAVLPTGCTIAAHVSEIALRQSGKRQYYGMHVEHGGIDRVAICWHTGSMLQDALKLDTQHLPGASGDVLIELSSSEDQRGGIIYTVEAMLPVAE